ncbi:MAG: low molecular weight phosphotyrosine protein phosphatase [Treponema sp.]|nr:low molecular weight phosphotyrosine protein phosphatase [Treponema sp.]
MTTLIRILFVCHGNICRSPMAEQILLDMIKKRKLQDRISVDSAATSTEEIGNRMDRRARERLLKAGIEAGSHLAVQIKKEDAEKYDWIICMDNNNMRNCYSILKDSAIYVTPKDVRSIFERDPASPISLNGMMKPRVCKLMDFTGNPRDVADPWYTGNFDQSFRDITLGCNALLSLVQE